MDELRKSYLFKLKCLDANSVLVKLAYESNGSEELLEDESSMEKLSDELKAEETFLTDDTRTDHNMSVDSLDHSKDEVIEEVYESEVIQDDMLNDENVEIYEVEAVDDFNYLTTSATDDIIEEEDHFDVIQERYLCSICDKTFESGTMLMEHDEEHKSDLVFTCREACGKKFNTLGAFETHKFAHFLQYEICKYCRMVIASPEEMNDHVATHDPELPFKCPCCENSYTHQYMLKVSLVFYMIYVF